MTSSRTFTTRTRESLTDYNVDKFIHVTFCIENVNILLHVTLSFLRDKNTKICLVIHDVPKEDSSIERFQRKKFEKKIILYYT